MGSGRRYREEKWMDDGSTKMCAGECGQELPATPDYFDRDAGTPDGLRGVCKMCRAATYERNKIESVDGRVRRLDETALRTLELVVDGGSDVPHVAELYQHLMSVFRGPGGFAAHFMGQFLMAKPGSPTRTKMLEIMARLAIKVSESGAAQLPIDLMSDEDLQIAFEKGLKRFAPRIAYDDGEAKEAS